MTTTKDQIKSSLNVVMLIAEAIRQSGSIPSGQLYAVVCDKLSLEQYGKVIGILKNAGVVRESNHLLTWNV